MLTSEQALALLDDLEADWIERTASLTNTDKFSEAVCAFANDMPNHRHPGYLMIGAHDNGSLSGASITDEILRNLASLRDNGNIQPLPALTVSRIPLPGGEIAVVEVQPSDLPPVRYKQRIWVRVGPRRGVANEQEERILTERRIARATTYDASPVIDAPVSELSLALFDDYRRQAVNSAIIDANHRNVEDQLASLRFFDTRKHVATIAGVLLFAKNPRFYLPGNYIQFLRLPTSSLTDLPSDQAELSGDLLQMLRELEARIRTNLRPTLRRLSALREQQVTDYPETALREILMNAVMHRDYQSTTPVRFYWFEDRIEVQSPGGLFGEVTQETLTRRNSYRNPILADAMKTLGYVNRFGYGIQRAQEAMMANGNPEIEFKIDDRVFLAVLRR